MGPEIIALRGRDCWEDCKAEHCNDMPTHQIYYDDGSCEPYCEQHAREKAIEIGLDFEDPSGCDEESRDYWLE